jgi:hypothetical protein
MLYKLETEKVYFITVLQGERKKKASVHPNKRLLLLEGKYIRIKNIEEAA